MECTIKMCKMTKAMLRGMQKREREFSPQISKRGGDGKKGYGTDNPKIHTRVWSLTAGAWCSRISSCVEYTIKNMKI